MVPLFGLPFRVPRNPALVHLNLNNHSSQLSDSFFVLSPERKPFVEHVSTHPRAIQMRAEAARKKEIEDKRISDKIKSDKILNDNKNCNRNLFNNSNEINSISKRKADQESLSSKENNMKRLAFELKFKGERKAHLQASVSLKENSANQSKADTQVSTLLKEDHVKRSISEPINDKKADPQLSLVKENSWKSKAIDPKLNTERKPNLPSMISKDIPIEMIIGSKAISSERKPDLSLIVSKEYPVKPLTFETKVKGQRKAHPQASTLMRGNTVKTVGETKTDPQSIASKSNIERKPKPPASSLIKENSVKRKADHDISSILKENPAKRVVLEPKTKDELIEKAAMSKTAARMKARMEGKEPVASPVVAPVVTQLDKPFIFGTQLGKSVATSEVKKLEKPVATSSEVKEIEKPATSSVVPRLAMSAATSEVTKLDQPAATSAIKPVATSVVKRVATPDTRADRLPLEILGTWTESIERFYIPEKIVWMTSNSQPSLEISSKQVLDWVLNSQKEEQEKIIFYDETVYDMVLLLKDVFNQLGPQNISRARESCDLFENINKDVFINHSAVKMANIDAMCEFMLTNPTDLYGNTLIDADEMLYYAEISARPGGVSEYATWRKNRKTRGFCFNTNNIKKMKLDDVYHGCPKGYTSHYGAKGDGNMLDPSNIGSFINLIMIATHGEGVHFLMADCAVTTEDGQESVQEVNSKQMYVAQCVLGLSVIGVHGHFVMKLLDVFTPFSVSLIFLIYKCFNKVSIIKPNTSKTTNSERYLVCKWRKPNTDDIRDLLTNFNTQIFQKTVVKEIQYFVPINIIQDDKEFIKYIQNSNSRIGEQQFVALKKIVAFHNDKSLIESRKLSIKTQCLQLWDLNDTTLSVPDDAKMTSVQYFEKYSDSKWCRENFFLAGEKSVKTIIDISTHVESVLDWKFVALDSHDSASRTFYMSRGGSDVLMYIQQKNTWVSPVNIKFNMPARTVVYGEIVKEYTGEDKMQTSKTAFHIIDAIMLEGRDVSKLPLSQRNRLSKIFTESLTQSDDTATIRTKELFYFTSINIFYYYLTQRKMLDDVRKYGFNTNNEEVGCNVFYIPSGILMMNEVRSDQMKGYSRKHDKLYFFDKTTRLSQFEKDAYYEAVYASFKNTFIHRFVWNIDNQEQFSDVKPKNATSHLMYRDDLMGFVKSKLEAGGRKR